MKVRFAPLALAVAASLAGAGVLAQNAELIQPIVPPQQVNLGMVELGKKLYFDPRLRIPPHPGHRSALMADSIPP